MERYIRQMAISGWGANGQEKLAKTTVLIAGSGGLGSPVSLYLAAAGVGKIIMCDVDTVNLSNLNRQILYGKQDIGKEKATRAVHRLKELNEDIIIDYHHGILDDNSLPGILQGVDLVMDCFDSFDARQILNRQVIEAALPMVHGAVESLRGQVSFIVPGETACLACFLPASGEPTAPPIAGAAAGVIGSLQAVEALKFLTGIGPTLKNKILFWDGMTQETNLITIKKRPDCSVCNKGVEPCV